MSLNKKIWIVCVIMVFSLVYACRADYTYEKVIRKHIRKHAEAEKLDICQLQYELLNVDYGMDSIERLKNSITDTFIVEKIYKGKEVYEIILYSEVQNKYYEIYSPREDCLRRKEIKAGQSYRMTIVPFYKEEGGGRPIEKIRPIYFKGYRIIPCPYLFGQVYVTDNLKGVCFLSDEML